MTTGVLVMAYGTPDGPEDVAAFYTDVRRGRPPSPEQLADLERRYQAIGGVSPLNARTAAQLRRLSEELEGLEPGRFHVGYGAKHARPKIEQGVDELVKAGADELVGLVLAPHFSRLSVGEYVERAGSRATEHGVPASFVEHWHDDPALIASLAERVEGALTAVGERVSDPERVEVCFTAHSLPARILDDGDPYPDQLEETARLVSAAVGLPRYTVGWQSAGRTPEPWLGPDVLDLVRTLAADGAEGIVVCPAGFTSDHLEILYDLDIEARRLADQLGVAFARTTSLNDDERVFASLARRLAAARPGADAPASTSR